MKNINFHFHAVRKKNILHTLYSRIITQTTMEEQRPVSTGALKKIEIARPDKGACDAWWLSGIYASVCACHTFNTIHHAWLASPSSLCRHLGHVWNTIHATFAHQMNPYGNIWFKIHTRWTAQGTITSSNSIYIYTYTQLSSAICFAVCLFYTC